MLKFVGRQWRGEAPFWISVLLFSLILPWALTFGGISFLSNATIESTPLRSMLTAALVFGLVGIVGVWQLVGTWRASTKAKAPDRWFVTRWAARFVALAGFALAAFAVSTTPPVMARYYSEMNDTDFIGQQPHALTVEGDQMEITGQLSWGLYDEFLQALSDNAELQTVVLNSDGGHFGVGRQMSERIRERGLDTLTTTRCASACTFAFLGGHRRMLQDGAQLGYHAPSGNTDAVLTRISNHAAGVLRAADVPEEFITQVFATPPESVWYPTNEELQEANIVTEIVD